MIDEKGRLFGKVNIVDLLIILVILAAVAFLGLKFFGPKGEATAAAPFKMTLICDESPDYVVEQLKKGVEVWDATDSVVLGTLTDFTVGPASSNMADSNNNVIHFSREGHSSVTLYIEGNGESGTHGVTIDGNLLAIGHSMNVYAGDCKLYLKISELG